MTKAALGLILTISILFMAFLGCTIKNQTPIQKTEQTPTVVEKKQQQTPIIVAEANRPQNSKGGPQENEDSEPGFVNVPKILCAELFEWSDMTDEEKKRREDAIESIQIRGTMPDGSELPTENSAGFGLDLRTNPLTFVGIGYTMVTGACCLPNGTCSMLTHLACVNSGGAYYGDGVSCGSGIYCAQWACCLPNGSCSIVYTSNDCVSQGGYAVRPPACTFELYAGSHCGYVVGNTCDVYCCKKADPPLNDCFGLNTFQNCPTGYVRKPFGSKCEVSCKGACCDLFTGICTYQPGCECLEPTESYGGDGAICHVEIGHCCFMGAGGPECSNIGPCACAQLNGSWSIEGRCEGLCVWWTEKDGECTEYHCDSHKTAGECAAVQFDACDALPYVPCAACPAEPFPHP